MYKPSKLIAEKTVELVVALSNGEDTQYLITTKDIKTKNSEKTLIFIGFPENRPFEVNIDF